jgi:serine/threonine protein kinase
MDLLTRYESLPLVGYCFLPNPSIGASYAASARDTSLDQVVQSYSEVDDTPGLAKLLRQILVLDPLQRPGTSDLLNHPWFIVSADPVIPSGSASE